MNRTIPYGKHLNEQTYEHKEIWWHVWDAMPSVESLVGLWPSRPEDVLATFVLEDQPTAK